MTERDRADRGVRCTCTALMAVPQTQCVSGRARRRRAARRRGGTRGPAARTVRTDVRPHFVSPQTRTRAPASAQAGFTAGSGER